LGFASVPECDRLCVGIKSHIRNFCLLISPRTDSRLSTTKKNSHGGSLRQALPKALSPTGFCSHREKKNCCGDAAVTPVALARRPRLPAATRQPPVISHSSLVISQQWLAVAQGQWFPGRPPSVAFRWLGGCLVACSCGFVAVAGPCFLRSWWLVSLAKSRCPRVPRSLVLCLRASVVLLSTLLLCHVYIALSIYCRVNMA
jgi:hypothetical protein